MYTDKGAHGIPAHDFCPWFLDGGFTFGPHILLFYITYMRTTHLFYQMGKTLLSTR